MSLFYGFATSLNTVITTTGYTPPAAISSIYPNVICSVYNPGTLVLATITDINGLGVANPFTINTDGSFKFYGVGASYDLKFTVGSPESPPVFAELLIPSYTFATLSAAAAALAGRVARVTDRNNLLFMDDGTQWVSAPTAEGSWTPAIQGTGGQVGQVHSVQVGRWLKTGRLVFVQGRVTLTTLGTVTGSVQIGGLPFTSENTAQNYAAASIAFWNNLSVAKVHLLGYIEVNTTAIRLVGANAAALSSATDLVQADLSDTFSIGFSAVYRSTT